MKTLLSLSIVLSLLSVPVLAQPSDNPLSSYALEWTSTIPWDNAISITDRHGATWEEKFSNAQNQLGPQGGVVYFPAGTYTFQEDIVLKHGVVIRGERPAGTAKDKTYSPPTVFEFPKYKPVCKGEGTATATAFKTIRLHDPAQDSRCGIVN
ncbi:hypothetical protein GF373_13615, partial [bacterium]|nr:hypothetical protein [bacterium]